MRDKHAVWNMKIFHRTWWDGATAGLNAPCTIKQQHRITLLGEIVGSSCACWPPANDGDIIKTELIHLLLVHSGSLFGCYS